MHDLYYLPFHIYMPPPSHFAHHFCCYTAAFLFDKAWVLLNKHTPMQVSPGWYPLNPCSIHFWCYVGATWLSFFPLGLPLHLRTIWPSSHPESVLSLSLHWSRRTGVTALESPHWSHRTGVTALESPHWSDRTGVTALESLHWSHYTGVTALESLHWSHCTGVTALESLHWSHCTGVPSPSEALATILHFFPSHPFFKQVHSLHKSASVSINSKVGQFYEALFSKTLGNGNYSKCKKSLCYYCLLRMVSRRQQRSPSVSEEDNVGCISSSHAHSTTQSFFWVFIIYAP